MTDELYADGIGEITVTGSVVRIDLVSLSATEKDAANKPAAVFRQRIIMSIEGFANAVDLMQKAREGLVEAGAVHRLPGTAGGAPDAAVTRASAERIPNASPNFN
ncbi:MAG: hypothetical protein ACTHJ3_08560 [Pararhizobium sp.]